MIREERLDPVVHYLEVRGELEDLAGRIHAALADGVRWLIVDLQRARLDRSVEAPLAAARDQASRPAPAASVEQALMILKLLRPKTTVG